MQEKQELVSGRGPEKSVGAPRSGGRSELWANAGTQSVSAAWIRPGH